MNLHYQSLNTLFRNSKHSNYIQKFVHLNKCQNVANHHRAQLLAKTTLPHKCPCPGVSCNNIICITILIGMTIFRNTRGHCFKL